MVPGPLDALSEVLEHARQNGNEIYLGFKSRAGHPDRLADAALLVDQVVLGNGMEELVVTPEADIARHVVDPGHVARPDLVAGDRHHPVGAAARHVLAGDAAVGGSHLDARHALSALHGPVDGAGGFLDVAHDAPPDAVAALDPHPENLGPALP